VADDLGFETVGTYGGTSYGTPNIDALADAGMRFDFAYSNPSCTPSRVKLMTGKYNLRNYVRFGHLPPGETTIAHILAQAGYKTMVAGKWQLGGADGQLPEEAGFDEHLVWNFAGISDGNDSRYWYPTLTENGITTERSGAFGPCLFSDYISIFLLLNRDRPFFVYYPMVLPHLPYVSLPGREPLLTNREKFIMMVEFMDSRVGQIIEAADLLGLSENTLILFLGDNGTNDAEVSVINGQSVMGGKGYPTDAGTHVPMVARWPGVVPAGTINLNIVDFTAVLPTMAEIANAEEFLPADLDGNSIVDELKGNAGDPRGWIYSYYEPRAAFSSVNFYEYARDKRYKLYSDGHFYDLERDILEQRPLSYLTDEAAAAREVLAALTEQIHETPGSAIDTRIPAAASSKTSSAFNDF
jgi:arylsulfatase A-like enzyme